MGIGTPTSCGTGGGNVSTSLTWTGTASIVSGNTAFIFAFINRTSNALPSTITTASDGTNSYTKFNNYTGNNSTEDGWDIEVWYKSNASAVTTPAYSLATGGTGTCWVAAGFQCSGLVTSSPTDIFTDNVSAGALSGSLSCSGTPASLPELAIGIFCATNGGSNPSVTPSSGFSSLIASFNNGNNTANAAVYYDVVTSGGTITWNPSWTETGNPAGQFVVLATFKGPPVMIGKTFKRYLRR